MHVLLQIAALFGSGSLQQMCLRLKKKIRFDGNLHIPKEVNAKEVIRSLCFDVSKNLDNRNRDHFQHDWRTLLGTINFSEGNMVLSDVPTERKGEQDALCEAIDLAKLCLEVRL